MGEVLRHFKSFGAQHQRLQRDEKTGKMGRVPKQTHPTQPYEYAHSGFAWAWRREFWERTGGVMDFPILGSADHHMAFAMIGRVLHTIHKGMHKNFFEMGLEWQRKAREVTHDEVGFVKGRLEHHFHGPKNKRFYRERWQILIDHNFDPRNDLYYDSAGVIQLKASQKALEYAIHQYNVSRSEDSIDTN